MDGKNWGLKEMRGQIGSDSWRSEFVEARISLELGEIQFSAETQKGDFSGLLSFRAEKGFSALQGFVLPVSRNTCWFVYCSWTREHSGGGGSYWVLCVGITSIWPHFQLNYICLTSSTWIHRTGHMGSTATGSEPKLNLLHYNIMSKEEKSFIWPW